MMMRLLVHRSATQDEEEGHWNNRQSLKGWPRLPGGSLKQPPSLLKSSSTGRVTHRNAKLTEYFIRNLEYFI